MTSPASTTSRREKICMAPLALASDGALLLNIALSDGPADPKMLVERASVDGGQLFIGIVLSPTETAFALKAIDDSTAEISGWLWGARQRRRREVARKIRKIPSRTSSGAPSKRRPAS